MRFGDRLGARVHDVAAAGVLMVATGAVAVAACVCSLDCTNDFAGACAELGGVVRTAPRGPSSSRLCVLADGGVAATWRVPDANSNDDDAGAGGLDTTPATRGR
jgi:hypothetical protein